MSNGSHDGNNSSELGPQSKLYPTLEFTNLLNPTSIYEPTDFRLLQNSSSGSAKSTTGSSGSSPSSNHVSYPSMFPSVSEVLSPGVSPNHDGSRKSPSSYPDLSPQHKGMWGGDPYYSINNRGAYSPYSGDTSYSKGANEPYSPNIEPLSSPKTLAKLKLKISLANSEEKRILYVQESDTFESVLSKIKGMYDQIGSIVLSYKDGSDWIRLKDYHDFETLKYAYQVKNLEELRCKLEFKDSEIPQSPSSTISSESESNHISKVQFTRLNHLGNGSFGTVSKIRLLDTGKICAMKEIAISQDEKKRNALQTEIDLMKKLRHEKIVSYLGCDISNTHCRIFMEYASEGSLQTLLDKEKQFSESLVRIYVQQILSGLDYLHKNSVIHRDIKCANVLCDHEGQLKLADFGCSKIVKELEGTSQMSWKGTLHFMAPESIKHAKFSVKSDIWSLGIMMIHMLTGKPPFCNIESQHKLMNQIANLKQPPTFPPNISNYCREFLNQCLVIDPSERATSSSLLQTDFIRIKPPPKPIPNQTSQADFTHGNYETYLSSFSTSNTKELDDTELPNNNFGETITFE